MSIADVIKSLAPNATPEQIKTIEDALAAQAAAIKPQPTTDTYDPNNVPVAEDPVIKWFRQIVNTIAALAGIIGPFVGGPAGAVISVVAAELPKVDPLVEAAILEAEKLAANIANASK
jgi:hypothetical protein